MLDNLRIGQKLLITNLLMAAIVCVTGAVGIWGVLVVGDSGIHAADDLAPIMRATMEIQLRATLAHLAVEEVTAGDREEEPEVWKNLDRARWYCDAILVGGRDEEHVFVAAQNMEVRRGIEEVRASLTEFGEQARTRMKQEGAGAGTNIDAAFDASFDSFMEKAETAEAAVIREVGMGVVALKDTRESSRNVMIAAMLAAVVVALLVGSRLTTSIAAPVVELARQAERISHGDLSVRLQGARREDEIGVLERAFIAMTDGMRAMIGNMQNGVATLTTSTAQIASTAQESAASATEQASTVSEVTTTVAEIGKTSETAAQTAKKVLEASEEAMEQGDRGVGTAREAAELMRVIQQRVEGVGARILELSEQTTQIREIIDTVDDLAEQSNLLAVNASIEAARAGEQGRGFSVVAGEVRTLAEQSKHAAQRVRVILGEVRRATDSAVMATEESSKRVGDGLQKVDGVRAVLDDLRAVLLDSADRARQIEAASREQAAGIGQIASVMDALNATGRETATAARQLRDAAGNLSTLGTELREASARYRI